MTYNDIIECVQASTKSITVITDLTSDAYYDSGFEITREDIQYIDPEMFLEQLRHLRFQEGV